MINMASGEESRALRTSSDDSMATIKRTSKSLRSPSFALLARSGNAVSGRAAPVYVKTTMRGRVIRSQIAIRRGTLDLLGKYRMNVGDLCNRNVVTALVSDSLTVAAQLMRAEHVGFLVVVEPAGDDGGLNVAGVLTDRDIVVAVVAREADPRSLKVADVMTRDPLVAKEGTSLESTLHFMNELGVRRVPVLGVAGRLVGVLALDDALRAIAQQLADIAGCIRNEQRVERCVRA